MMASSGSRTIGSLAPGIDVTSDLSNQQLRSVTRMGIAAVPHLGNSRSILMSRAWHWRTRNVTTLLSSTVLSSTVLLRAGVGPTARNDAVALPEATSAAFL